MRVSEACEDGRAKRRRQRGFTLLEMSIVLAIVGLIIGIAAPIIGDIARSAREKTTNANLELLENALTVFAQRNGRLPCPAAPNGNPLGNERATCNTVATAQGIIPFRTLGLNEELARDGYGNPYTYTVASDFAATSTIGGFCGVVGTTAAGTLTVNDENGAPVTSDQVPFMLVSHGDNGTGAFITGTTNQVSTGQAGDFEVENADGDSVFVLAGDATESSATGAFDDILRWTSRDAMGTKLRVEGCDGDTETLDNLKLIQDALVSFLRRNGRLPCPAAPDGAILGDERATCTSAQTLVGIVPFRTLSLPEAAAMDGYERYLTYQVAEAYSGLSATSNSIVGYCAVNSAVANASLTIRDGNNTALTSDLVPVVVLSHGENGFGFFQVPQATRFSATSGNAIEDENADGDIVYMDDTGADDVVGWWTKDTLAELANPSDACDVTDITESNLDLIETALVSFLRRNGRIPCPGAPNASPLGFERVSCTSNNTRQGIVPFRTLNLPEAVAQDGYGHYLSYQAAGDYPSLGTTSNSIGAFCGVNPDSSTSTLTVVDGNGIAVSSQPVAAVVLSHGANGYGYYEVPANSQFSSNGGDSSEDENADEDTSFVDRGTVAGGYDDVVRWWTKEGLGSLADPSAGCDMTQITQAHLDAVEAALATYLLRNGEIPCPAQPEDDSPLGEAPATCNSNPSDDGIVPFRTLGLSQNIAEDGYGRLFTYHIDLNYADTGSIAAFCSETSSDLTVNDQNDDPVVASFSNTPIVYTLVSHGENGYGHYVAGSSNQVNGNGGTSNEDENADDDDTYIDSPRILTGGEAGYDDITRWQTRGNLVTAAGGTCP